MQTLKTFQKQGRRNSVSLELAELQGDEWWSLKVLNVGNLTYED